MRKTAAKKTGPILVPRWRVMSGPLIVLGPGKADLLALVAETGSLRQAAARLDMSYMRAWSLVRVMNRSFRTPLVESLRGGKSGGGARLTPSGKRVLALYQELEKKAQSAAAPPWKKLKRELK
jgi:molybdate transport system regulatory protein